LISISAQFHAAKHDTSLFFCYFDNLQVEDLRRDGLVVLGLTSAQYRQLGMLREATAALSVSLDALRYDR
jgi:hypothetical protein